MKNKKLTYILLPMVIIIWGFVFWKFYKGFSSSGTKEDIIAIRPSDDQVIEEPDTISLSFQYDDPFLHYGNGNAIEHSASPRLMKRPNIVVAWPKIEYTGSIGKRRLNKYLGLLKISGKENLVSEGDEVDKVKVLSVTPDSVSLEYMSDRRSFPRIGY